ncbi:MAG: hypothetical protein GY765_18680 [bacterium]|nr:hypothetical protein [bacterium]
MQEVIKINWVPVLSGLMCVSGLALLLAEFCIGKFSKNGAAGKPKTPRLIAAVLLPAGLLLYPFKMPTDNIFVTRIVSMDSSKTLTFAGEVLSFQVPDLTLDRFNRKHKDNSSHIKDNTAALFYDGYMETPPVNFDKGSYQITFWARGSRVNDQYAILKIQVRMPDKNGYLLAPTTEYHELTGKMEHYVIPMEVPVSTVGWITISFVNDFDAGQAWIKDKKHSDRNAWVKDITIWKKK